jgi:RNA polymerase sigma-70 factor (family 1)
LQQSSTYYQPEILQKIASGDEQAFNLLYHTHWKKLYTFLMRMTKSREIAEELMLDIFTKLWTRREQIAEINDIDAYLSQTAYNKALNFFRYTARQKKLQQAIMRQSLSTAATISPDSAAYIETKELINKAIEHLSPQRKLIFKLRKEYRLTNNEIAKELNLSPTTVKKTMSSALRSLRSFLRQSGVEATIYLLFINFF